MYLGGRQRIAATPFYKDTWMKERERNEDKETSEHNAEQKRF